MVRRCRMEFTCLICRRGLCACLWVEIDVGFWPLCELTGSWASGLWVDRDVAFGLNDWDVGFGPACVLIELDVGFWAVCDLKETWALSLRVSWERRGLWACLCVEWDEDFGHICELRDVGFGPACVLSETRALGISVSWERRGLWACLCVEWDVGFCMDFRARGCGAAGGNEHNAGDQPFPQPYQEMRRPKSHRMLYVTRFTVFVTSAFHS